MKAAQITVGCVYDAKVSDRVVPVKVVNVGRDFRNRVRYECVNLTTGRTITVRSAQRFRNPTNVSW